MESVPAEGGAPAEASGEPGPMGVPETISTSVGGAPANPPASGGEDGVAAPAPVGVQFMSMPNPLTAMGPETVGSKYMIAVTDAPEATESVVWIPGVIESKSMTKSPDAVPAPSAVAAQSRTAARCRFMMHPPPLSGLHSSAFLLSSAFRRGAV